MFFPFSQHFPDWRKKVSDYGANFLAQSLKLNCTRTEDYFERQQNSQTFLSFGPRASTFQSLVKLSGPVVKTRIYMYRSPFLRETKFSIKT